MKLRPFLLLTVVTSLPLLGCQSREAPRNTDGEIPELSSTGISSSGAATEAELIELYERAQEEGALEAAMNLVSWNGVPRNIKESISARFTETFAYAIENAEVGPIPENQLLEYTVSGRTYRPNVKVTGKLIIRYENRGQAIQTTSYLIGIKGDRYFIAVGVPEGDAPTQGAGGSDRQYSVSVMGVIAPDPVEFEGYCNYTSNGKEIQEDFSGAGNIMKAFRAKELTSCEIKQISEDGWIQLTISVDGKEVFESERTNGPGTITYQQ